MRGRSMSATRSLAEYVVESDYAAIPKDVRAEAKRALLYYLGCALGGSPEPALDIAIRVLAPYSGRPTATVVGRPVLFDPLHAAPLHGLGSPVTEIADMLPYHISLP